jgi:hypothetical protein
MRNSIILLGIVVWFSACSSQTESTNQNADLEQTSDSLAKLVLSIHDEVMPEMSKVRELKSELKTRMDSLELDSATLSSYQLMSNDLEGAGEDMMQWMRNFNRPADSASVESVMAYYTAELERIRKVKDQMQSAIGKASKELESQN